ncbi:two-component sensor histidine kinase [Micromonospora sp. CPCC 205371]|nr:two-component sensor histidine kinase [Micromonospora sp. CPCC 205371]
MRVVSSRGFRGPFARWPRASDATLAAVLFLTTVFVTDAPDGSLELRSITDIPVVALVIFAVTAAVFYLRRRRPILVLGVAVAGWALLLPTGPADLGLITMFALYSAGRYAASSRHGLAGLAAAMTVLVVDDGVRTALWAEVSFGAVLMFVVWYVGRRLRLREERAAESRRQRETEARRIVAEERTHIARELHDVVAHQVSMMTVQAGAAQAVVSADPESARQAMAAVELAGRQALDELRHLLGVLRPETERGGLGPQPGLADLPRLIAQVRAAGLDVRITDDLRTPLPTRVQLSAYRIIQEALTNVLKHGGPGTRTEVNLREDGTDMTIEVIDHAQPGLTRPQTVGHGIVGMRERATLLGGSLETGPRLEGGFRVLARLPLAGEA